MSRFAALVLLVAAGCEGPQLRCPSGACTGPLADAGALEAEADAAIADATAPAPGTEGGGGWTLEPPGTPPASPGCDEASGECDAWEAALVGELDRCASLAIDPAGQEIAERHAQHQADLDRLTGESPDGSLFDQLRAEGVSYRDGGAAFSVTRRGPADVLARWSANESTAAILDRCWTHIGAAFRTSETGASYVTVVLIAR